MLRASSSRGSVSWLSRLAARNRRVLLKLVLQKLAGAENFGVALYRLLNAQSVVIARLSLLVVAARGAKSPRPSETGPAKACRCGKFWRSAVPPAECSERRHRAAQSPGCRGARRAALSSARQV